MNTYKGIRRHPAKGTGEICDKLAEETLKPGGVIHYKAQVTEMRVRTKNPKSEIRNAKSEIVRLPPSRRRLVRKQFASKRSMSSQVFLLGC